MTARFLEVTVEQYHADPCEQPSLSSSIAHELIDRSPLHAWQIHPKLGGHRREASASMTDGTLIHALLLGQGEERIAVLDVPDFRTNAAKDARDKALAEGKCVVKKSDYDAALVVVDVLRERIAAQGIKLDGSSEEKIEWTQQTDEGAILCRGMLDHLKLQQGRNPRATIYDVKTCRSAALPAVQRHLLDYGCDIQEAAYRAGISKVVPEVTGRVEFVFLFCEIELPCDVTPVTLDGRFRHMGEAKWDRACWMWAHCLSSGKWPGYVSQITQVEPPPWALGPEGP
jgi:hypothetical protein